MLYCLTASLFINTVTVPMTSFFLTGAIILSGILYSILTSSSDLTYALYFLSITTLISPDVPLVTFTLKVFILSRSTCFSKLFLA